MSTPLRVYVDHGEAYGNLGDEAMLLSALTRLQKYLGPCEFLLTAEPGKPLPRGLPEVAMVLPPRVALARWARVFRLPFAAGARIPFVGRRLPRPKDAVFWRMAAKWADLRLFLSRSLPFRTLGGSLRPFVEAIRTCDAFYGVGAADFSDLWLEGVVYKSWLYRAARRHVRVSVLSSQGIGPLETPWARRMMRRAFGSLDLLSFRDRCLSKAIVESERPAGVRYRIVGDEALSLPGSMEEEALALLGRAGLPEGASFVAVHFRMTDYVKETRYLIPRIAGMLDRIGEVVPHYFVFFPMSYHTHSGFDEECGREIRARMSLRERLILAPVCEDAATVKRAVRAGRYSLGLSYHVHLFSLSQGHPAVILYTGDYYRCKSEGLVGFYGSPSAALDLERATDREIVEAVIDVESRYQEACQEIAAVNEALLKNNDWTIRQMAALLGRELRT